MMDFKEFSIQMESDLRRYLDDNSPGTQIRQNDVEKMQGQSYQALTINPEGSPIGMNINLTRMYEQMQDGAGYDAVLDQVLKQTDNFLEEVPDFDVKSISNYEQSKSRLFVEVVSAERNADMLQNMPHMQIEDARYQRFTTNIASVQSGGVSLTTRRRARKFANLQNSMK